MNIQQIYNDGEYVLFDPEIIHDIAELSFDSKEYARRNAIIGFAEGRGTTFFFEHHGLKLVLRHYRRGGMVSRYITDRYLWLGLGRTRAWREWALLEYMRTQKLPVPRPVATRVCRQGISYTADIIIEKIANAHALAAVLSRERLAASYWAALGGLIHRFHAAGIYHADLNANNILLDEGGRFYLIDFDKGEIKRQAPSWKRRVLMRLHRSLKKLQGSNPEFHFRDDDWNQLIQGYSSIGGTNPM